MVINYAKGSFSLSKMKIQIWAHKKKETVSSFYNCLQILPFILFRNPVLIFVMSFDCILRTSIHFLNTEVHRPS